MTGMTAAEAGRRGGLATLARYGVQHFRRIGAATKGFPPGAGAKGYRAQVAALGPDGMHAKAVRAGEGLLAKRGKAHYAELGRKGAAVKRAKREAATDASGRVGLREEWFAEELTGWGIRATEAALAALAIDAPAGAPMGAPCVENWDAADAEAAS